MIVPSFQWPDDGKGNRQEMLLSSSYFYFVASFACLESNSANELQKDTFVSFIFSCCLLQVNWFNNF